MRSLTPLALCVAASVSHALFIPNTQQVLNIVKDVFTESERCLVELAPGETKWINEEDKWELRRVCC